MNSLIKERYFFQQSVSILDPSELYRPDKDVNFADKDVKGTNWRGQAFYVLNVPKGSFLSFAEFRDYTVTENDPQMERVFQTYKAMHTNQTVDFVKGTLEKIHLF